MSGHQVRLRWTTHQGTLFGVLQSLLAKNFLVDVTLAAEGQYMRAHKVILCACSPYFEELLSITDDKHPIIMLQDVKYVQLQALISYMYCGEVNIDEANLPALLRIAEALQIRGLFGATSSSSSKHDNDDSTDGDETPNIEPKCWSSQDRVNSSSDLLTPPPSKKVKSGNSTNTNSSFGPARSSDMQTDCESKSPRKESGDATMSPEAAVANSSSASSSTSQPAGTSATNNNKRGSKSERNRRTSISTQGSVPDTQIKIDKDVDSTPHSVDSDSLEPNQSYLFENYFSSEESFRDEIIIPASPPPDDDDKDEEHTQEDGLPLGANSDQIFRCFKCGKQYTSNKSLWRHRKFACEGKQTFSCQLCGKSFSRSDNLRRHAVVAHCIQ